jgi:hypothetical protein
MRRGCILGLRGKEQTLSFRPTPRQLSELDDIAVGFGGFCTLM